MPFRRAGSDDYRIVVRRYLRNESNGEFVHEPMESYGIEIPGWGSSEGVTRGNPISIADRVIGCTPGEPCDPGLDLIVLDPLTMTPWGRDVNNLGGLDRR